MAETARVSVFMFHSDLHVFLLFLVVSMEKMKGDCSVKLAVSPAR